MSGWILSNISGECACLRKEAEHPSPPLRSAATKIALTDVDGFNLFHDLLDLLEPWCGIICDDGTRVWISDKANSQLLGKKPGKTHHTSSSAAHF